MVAHAVRNTDANKRVAMQLPAGTLALIGAPVLLTIGFGDRTVQVPAGSLVFADSDAISGLTAKEAHAIPIIWFPRSAITRSLALPTGFCRLVADTAAEKFVASLFELYHHVKDNTGGYAIGLPRLFEAMKPSLAEIILGEAPSGILTQRRADLYRSASAFIEERVSDADFSVSSIADQLGVTYRQVTNVFKKVANVSPTDYLNARRVEHAQRYLLDPHVNAGLSQVAFKSGFSSENYLCRVFKARTGLTPIEYRRAHRAGELQ